MELEALRYTKVRLGVRENVGGGRVRGRMLPFSAEPAMVEGKKYVLCIHTLCSLYLRRYFPEWLLITSCRSLNSKLEGFRVLVGALLDSASTI